MERNNIPVPAGLIARKTVIFLLFYLIFFLYLRLIVGTNLELMYFVNSIVLIIFVLSSYKIKFGLYLFIFLIPLLNSSNNFLVSRPRYIVVFMFFGLFLGFLVNHGSKYLTEYPNNADERFIFDRTMMKLILIFTGVLVISCAITIFRYSNFYPFIANEYHDLAININGVRSTGSMIWTIRYFYNYLIGFLFLFLIFNVIKSTKDVLYSIIVIISATMISVGVVLHQYFVNPYLGNVAHWVRSGRFNATFTDPNALGGFTILLFPVFLGMILYFKKWYMRLIFFFLFLLFLILLLLAGSRSAFIGIFLAAVIFIILFIIRGLRYLRNRMASWPGKKKAFVLSIIILIILCLILAIIYLVIFQKDLISKSSMIDRTLKSVETGIFYFSKYGIVEGLKSISNYRYIFWGQAIEMFKDYPVTGVGQGAYILQLPNYLVSQRTCFAQVDYSGNYYLQILSELGLPGIILIISIFFILIKRVSGYFIARRRSKIFENKDWILISLFISFIAMLVGQIFGPHTNFDEVQLIFWLVIGLMIAYIKVEQINSRGNIRTLEISSRIRFSLREKLSLSIILFIFFSVFLFNSLTTLSINVEQNLYDRKDNYVGWQNDYGFYREEISEEGPFSWVAQDASTVIEKKGEKLIIPIKDAYPEYPDKELSVKIFIDNLLVEKTALDYNKWENIEIDIPQMAKEHFTLTLVFNRGWSPKELGINNDTRVFGGKIKKIVFAE